MLAIAPLLGLSARPAGQAPDCATVALPAPPSVAAAPLTRSLAATLAIGVPALPAAAVPASATGTIAALTVRVSVVVAQLAGVPRSHSWYVRE